MRAITIVLIVLCGLFGAGAWLQESRDLLDGPNVVSDPGSHRGSDAQGGVPALGPLVLTAAHNQLVRSPSAPSA
jgi:hypothetical protein